MPELNTLGDVIKPTYEQQPNTNAFTDSEKAKLASLPDTVTPSSIGLGNVDNTSDLDKPISTETQEALLTRPTIAEVQDLIANASVGSGEGPTLTSSPTISGVGTVDQVLTATDPVFDNADTVASQWFRGDTAIAGQTGLTYTGADADLGYIVRRRTTATNETGSTVVYTNGVSFNTLNAVPGRIISLNANDIISTYPAMGAVAQWNDEFGGDSVSQPSASLRPTLTRTIGSYTAMGFVPEQKFNMAISASSGLSIFMDIVPDTTSARNIVTSATGGIQIKTEAGGALSILRDGQTNLLTSPAVLVKGQRSVLSFKSGTNFNEISHNGTVIATNTTNPAYTQPTNSLGGDSTPFSGAMLRFVAYSGILNAAQTDFVENYLINYQNQTAPPIPLISRDKTINAMDYGVIPDGIRLIDVAITAGQSVVTSPTYSFTSADVGKLIAIKGAGEVPTFNTLAAFEPLNAYIGSVTNGAANLVTTQGGSTPKTAVTTVTAASAIFGTNNFDALSAVNSAAFGMGGGVIDLPAGIIVLNDTLEMLNRVKWQGKGQRSTLFKYIRTDVMGPSIFTGLNASASSPTMDWGTADFAMDLSDATVSGYSVSKKFYYGQWLVRPIVERMFMIGSPATSVGMDFMVDARIQDNIIYNSGRRNGAAVGNGGSGGAAIGIGTTSGLITVSPGLTRPDSYLVTGNQIYYPTRYGIFVENQSTLRSKGSVIISNNIIHMEANSLVGIADCGNEKIIVSNNHINGKGAGVGIKTSKGTISNSLAGIGGSFLGNTINNVSIGISVDYSDETAAIDASYTVRGNKIVASQSDGIQIKTSATAGYTVSNLIVENNEVSEGQKAGISFIGTAPVKAITVAGNKCWNNGKSGTGLRSGVYFGIDADIVRFTENDLYDLQGTATQVYGLELAAGVDLTKTIFGSNLFDGNLTAPVGLNTTGTITGKITDTNLGYTP